jgi:hypothetical protein
MKDACFYQKQNQPSLEEFGMKAIARILAVVAVLLTPMAANAASIAVPLTRIDFGDISDGTSNTLSLTATYSGWTKAGPLSFGLAAMPDEFSATFLLGALSIPPTPPGVPIPYPISTAWTTSDVLSSSVTFGDATWTTLASFGFGVDANGVVFLDYAFQPLALTQTAMDSIVLNGPLMITGTDTATGQDFTYGYGIRTLSLEPVAVPEPVSLALFGIGILGMGAARRRKKS